MGYKRNREGDPTWNPRTGRWTLYAPKATETSYLGGLTLPSVTRRPHMGPFNRVTDYKISDEDEVYRRHDIGYGKELKAGRSPYTRWNRYDEDLMDAPATGWPDYVAKGVFGAKRFFTYGIPHAEHTRLRDVYGRPTEQRGYNPDVSKWTVNYQDAPVEIEGGGIDPDLVELMGPEQARRWANKGGVENFTRQNAGGGGKLRSQVSYEWM